MRKKLLGGGVALLAAALALETLAPRGHEAHGLLGLPGFEFVFGVAGGAFLAVFCKLFLHRLIGRKEGYYRRAEDES